jgi:spore germination cell wall hydrolase CwlJ-like protein
MFRFRELCHPLLVKPGSWLLAVLGALAVSASAAASAFVPPIIRLSDSPETVLPVVSFSIPSYELTAHDRETIAACLILEAASQGDYGMRAVMAVIRNRSRGMPELFAPTVLRPKQFSALNSVTGGRESLGRLINRAKRDVMWFTALNIVNDAIDGAWYDPTGGATHYTRAVERTHWTRSLAKTVTIGVHSFYR